MSEEKKGIDELKKVLALIVKSVKLGQTVSKDGIGAEDIAHIPELIDIAKDLIALIKESEEIAAEAKDIDSAEALAIAMELWTDYKEIAGK